MANGFKILNVSSHTTEDGVILKHVEIKAPTHDTYIVVIFNTKKASSAFLKCNPDYYIADLDMYNTMIQFAESNYKSFTKEDSKETEGSASLEIIK